MIRWRKPPSNPAAKTMRSFVARKTTDLDPLSSRRSPGAVGEWGQSKELRIMSSHVHIALYDALREAGASEEKARAAAGGIPVGEHLATK